MKKGLLILLLLSACGGAEDDDHNHGYGWHYDEIGESGLRVRFDDNARKLVKFEEIEQWYLDVQECTGIKANGPLVIFVTENIDTGGLWFWDSSTIIVWSADHAIFFPTRGSTTKHEFIHYLLNESGFPLDRNDAHDSYLWSRCSF